MTGGQKNIISQQRQIRKLHQTMEELISETERCGSIYFDLKTLNLPLNSVMLFQNILYKVPESGLKLCIALQSRKGFVGTDIQGAMVLN